MKGVLYMETKKEINTIIGNSSRSTRLNSGFKAKALAAAIGATPDAITKYEKGTVGISAARLALAAEFLRVPVSALLPSEKQIRDIKKAEE